MKSIVVWPCEQVEIGRMPDARFSAIINVSDSTCSTFDHSIPSFWFPIQELGIWGHAPFYGAAKVVDQYGGGDLPVAIHCHAGVNRSMCVALAIQLAEGHSIEYIEQHWPKISNGFSYDLFLHNIKRKCIPENIVEFLGLRYKHPTYSILGLLGIMGARDCIYAERKQLKETTDSEL